MGRTFVVGTSRLLPGRRPTRARRLAALVAVVLVVVALAGCGGRDPDQQGTSDPAFPEDRTAIPSPTPSKSPAPSSPSGGTMDEPGLVALVTASQAEGSTDAPPVLIDRVSDVGELVAGLDRRLGSSVRRQAASLLPDVPDDLQLVAAVVWVGCEVPSDVRVDGSGASVRLTAVVPDKGSVQCLVPVTTVAFALAPRG